MTEAQKIWLQKWDFRLPLVCSINASGHKYGLTYVSLSKYISRHHGLLTALESRPV